MLAKHNGGKYLADKVTAVLRGEAMLTAHGTQEMPVWYRCSGRGARVHEGEMQQPSPTCLGTSNRSRQSDILPTLAPGQRLGYFRVSWKREEEISPRGR
jgi:hypothetical protein